MNVPLQHPRAVPPMPAVARILSQFDRKRLGAAIEVMIALLDVVDGDPESEELPLEDAFVIHASAPVTQDCEAEGGAWIEWSTMRGSQKGGSRT